MSLQNKHQGLPMFFNNVNTPNPGARSQLLTPNDPRCYHFNQQHQQQHQQQQYHPAGSFHNGNTYPSGNYHQIQSGPPPGHYLTITQFNYHSIGYPNGYSQPAATTNFIFRPPPVERRCIRTPIYRFLAGPPPFNMNRPQLTTGVPEPPRPPLHRDISTERFNGTQNGVTSSSSENFELTYQSADQLTNGMSNETYLERPIVRAQLASLQINPEVINNGQTQRVWANCKIIDPLILDEEDLTKFIVDGCYKAEAIAIKNQHRPCFKNIRHLCTRTRTDILKPKTTVANIHSQGIPWATKDFIFAFVRLINCWYILKGYLDHQGGNLGKIETTLSPEFKKCYQQWQRMNKQMLGYLINAFVNLDHGVTVQNAQIYSSFNKNKNATSSNCSFPGEDRENDSPKPSTSTYSCPTTIPSQKQQILKKVENPFNKTPKSFCRIPFTASSENSMYDDEFKSSFMEDFEDVSAPVTPICNSTPDGRSQIYMKPGSYQVPKKSSCTIKNDEPQLIEPMKFLTNFDANVPNFQSSGNDNTVWNSAIRTFRPFMENILKDATTNSLVSTNSSFYNSVANVSNPVDDDNKTDFKQTLESISLRAKDTEAWVNAQIFGVFGENKITVIEENIKCEEQTEIYAPNNIFYRGRNDSRYSKNESGEELSHVNKIAPTQLHFCNSFCLVCFSDTNLGFCWHVTEKFKKIINALWKLPFARYITFEVNAENVPDFYKYIDKPMFLCKIMNNLKQNKYMEPLDVVRDLKIIIQNSEMYLKRRPDWWFEQCLLTFSKELDLQLAENFPSINFNSATGVENPIQPLTFDFRNIMKPSDDKK